MLPMLPNKAIYADLASTTDLNTAIQAIPDDAERQKVTLVIKKLGFLAKMRTGKTVKCTMMLFESMFNTSTPSPAEDKDDSVSSIDSRSIPDAEFPSDSPSASSPRIPAKMLEPATPVSKSSIASKKPAIETDSLAELFASIKEKVISGNTEAPELIYVSPSRSKPVDLQPENKGKSARMISAVKTSVRSCFLGKNGGSEVKIPAKAMVKKWARKSNLKKEACIHTFFHVEEKVEEKEAPATPLKALFTRSKKTKHSTPAAYGVGLQNKKGTPAAAAVNKVKSFFSMEAKRPAPVIIGVQLLIKPEECEFPRSASPAKEDARARSCEKKVSGRFGKFAAGLCPTKVKTFFSKEVKRTAPVIIGDYNCSTNPRRGTFLDLHHLQNRTRTQATAKRKSAGALDNLQLPSALP